MPDRYVREVSPFRLPLLDRVPTGAVVLDVGPWTGAHGHHLIAERGATVDGVELDAEAAAHATRYRKVIVGSIEDESVQGQLATYDVVLLLDVLEHLADPAAVLRRAASWLRPDGIVLCSIPNVAHWRVRLSLLRGKFEYTDSGLLDRTHLRWFTRASARRLIEDAGYRITWENATVPQPPRIKVPQRLLKPELFGYQFLFEGRTNS